MFLTLRPLRVSFSYRMAYILLPAAKIQDQLSLDDGFVIFLELATHVTASGRDNSLRVKALVNHD